MDSSEQQDSAGRLGEAGVRMVLGVWGIGSGAGLCVHRVNLEVEDGGAMGGWPSGGWHLREEALGEQKKGVGRPASDALSPLGLVSHSYSCSVLLGPHGPAEQQDKDPNHLVTDGEFLHRRASIHFCPT